jgi:hypothetical protein
MCQSKVRCLFVFASRCHPDRAKRRGISLRFPPSSKSDYLQPKSVFLSSIFLQRTHTTRSHSPTESSPLVVIPTERSDEGPLSVSRHHPKAITCNRNLSFSPLSFGTAPMPKAIPQPNGAVASRCHPDRAQRRGTSLRFPPSSQSDYLQTKSVFLSSIFLQRTHTKCNPIPQRSRRLSLSSRQSAATRDLSSFPAIIQKLAASTSADLYKSTAPLSISTVGTSSLPFPSLRSIVPLPLLH